MRHILFTSVVLVGLSGCAVTSFAPPVVNLQQGLQFSGTQSTFNAVCSPKALGAVITTDMEGALTLINNYILTYRCQRDRAAEGRQFFDVPGFLTSAGAATAAALGAGPHVAIGAGATSLVLGQGKSYYAPKDKATVLSDGLKGMLCIHNEAVGIDGPTLEAISQVQQSSGPPPTTNTTSGVGGGDPNVGNGGAGVYVTSERQYFNMIATALWSVEQVMSDRLSNSGKQFDTSGVLAELEKLKKEAAAKESGSGAKPEEVAKPVTDAPKPPPAPAVATSVLPDGTVVTPAETKESKRANAFNAAQEKIESFDPAEIGRTLLQLRALKPKLDQCVVQSKV